MKIWGSNSASPSPLAERASAKLSKKPYPAAALNSVDVAITEPSKDTTTTTTPVNDNESKDKVAVDTEQQLKQQEELREADATPASTAEPAREDAPPASSSEQKKGNKTLSRMLFSNSKQDNKRDQVKVMYRQFGPDAESVLTVEHDAGGMPSPDAPDHVVVKVQVRRPSICASFVHMRVSNCATHLFHCHTTSSSFNIQQASTVTLDDCLMRRGFDFDVLDPLCLPQTPGFDIVGTISACGSQATGFQDGDRVAAIVRTGGNARYLSVPVSSLVKIPRTIDEAEAAAMVSIYTTAYQTLKCITQKGPMFSLLGNRVLIVGGMDAVGQALIQMCNKARAEIYATGPKHRHPYIKNILGVIPLPDDKEEWLPMVKGRMDFVFDGVCEDGLESANLALKKGGEVVCFGHSAMLKEREMGILGAPLMAHVSTTTTTTLATGVDECFP